MFGSTKLLSCFSLPFSGFLLQVMFVHLFIERDISVHIYMKIFCSYLMFWWLCIEFAEKTFEDSSTVTKRYRILSNRARDLLYLLFYSHCYPTKLLRGKFPEIHFRFREKIHLACVNVFIQNASFLNNKFYNQHTIYLII